MPYKFNKSILWILIFLIGVSSLPITPTAAADSTTITKTVELFKGSTKFDSSVSRSNVVVDLNSSIPEGYQIKSFEVWKDGSDGNGGVKRTNQGEYGAISPIVDNKLTFKNFNGTLVDVNNIGYTSNMYFEMKRQSNGKVWYFTTQGATYFVTPSSNSDCWVNGKAECVGILNKDINGNTLPVNKARDANGWGLAISNGFTGPGIYYYGTEPVQKTNLRANTVKITSANAEGDPDYIRVAAFGNKTGGNEEAYLSVATKMTIDNPLANNEAISLKYNYQTKTNWSAKTFLYGGEVRLTLEPIPVPEKPYISCSCAADPATVTFTDSDIKVKSTLNAKINLKESLTVKNWTLYGKAADGSQLTTQTSVFNGKDSIAQDFNFTIPKEKLTGVDSYTETWVMRARVYFTDGTSAEQAIECTTMVTQPNATPAPSPDSTPLPTSTPAPAINVDVEFQPSKIITGEQSSLLDYGDDVESYTWTFSDNLSSILPNQSDREYRNVTYTEPGIYKAEMTGYNGSLTDKDTAYLEVVDPKPIAIVTGLKRVIQGRPFLYPHHLLNSYSPIADRGVTIDFTKSEIRYKKVGDATYTEGWPAVAPMDLGMYSIEGKVYDSEGRVSEWGTLLMEVVPDLPPTISVIAPEEAYRNSDIMLFIQAESPDGDQLEHLFLEERYDADNDSNFDEEAWSVIYDGTYKDNHMLDRYAKVGKRQYRATVTEDFGLQGISEIVTTDILNIAPTTDFNVSGTIQQPDQGDDSAPPITKYSADSIFRSWTAKQPYTGGTLSKLGWKSNVNSISTKNAFLADFFISYPNMGNGSNGRSLYNIADDLTGQVAWSNSDTPIQAVFAGHRIYTRATATVDTITERNAITGASLRSFTITKDGYRYGQIDKKENFYYYGSGGSTQALKIKVYDKYGSFVHEHSIAGDETATGSPGVRWSEISPDGKYLYIIAASEFIDATRYIQLHFIKYDLTTRSVIWDVAGTKEAYKPTFLTNFFATIDSNGELIVSYMAEIFGDSYVRVAKVRNTAVVSELELILTSTDASYPVVSADGKFIYLATSRTNSSGTSFESYLRTIKVTATTLEEHNRSSIDRKWTAGSVLFNNREKYGIATPIVRSNGNVYTTTKLNYGDKLFNSEGTAAQAENTSGVKAINYRMYQLPNGKTTYPNAELFNGRTPSITTATWASGTDKVYIKNTVSKQLNETLMLTADQIGMTSILPDGAMYFFAARYVVPFVSAASLTGSSVYPKAVDSDTVEISDDNWAGLLYDPSSVMKNYALSFDVSVNNVDNAKTIGAAFNIKDEKNMYAVEWNKSDLTLFKVVNGVKTQLKTVTFARSSFTPYAVKVESVNGTLRVFINHVKQMEVEDTTYVKGAAGIMSLGQPQTYFSNVQKNNYGDSYIEQTAQIVLVNDPIHYEKIFEDSEADPMDQQKWSYSHDPNFFANPEGLSIHSGQTYAETKNTLDKPGLYEITFQANDNPGISSYAKWSEPVSKSLYVHRRPVALPDVRFTGTVYPEGEALDYTTYDMSYDPDVPDYLAERLIRTRWADQSTWTTGARLLYNRAGVELIIQEQVKDIHGAWSYWEEVSVYKDVLPPVNQTKPKMVITSPNGTAVSPTTLLTDPIVKWTYSDAENDPQEQFFLTFSYVDTGAVALELTYPGDDVAFEVESGTFDIGRKMKVQGRVYSNDVWSDNSNIVYFIINTPPTTILLNFNGLNAAKPVYTNSNKPQLQVLTKDEESHPIKYVDYEVFYAAAGVKVVDTNTATGNATYTTNALQEGLHFWKARANDGYQWGPYSSNGFFFVDTVKPADVDEQLDIKLTAVTVQFNAFSDPAPSSGHAKRVFYLQKVHADGSVTTIDLNGDGAAEYSVPLSLSKQSYKVTGLVPGQKYRLTVIDDDIAGNQGYFEYIYFNTNQAPKADFDWSPKPVYEGDRVTFASEVSDADGDVLTVTYEVKSPSGKVSNYSYSFSGPIYPNTAPKINLMELGTWRVWMTVSDGIADAVIVTKSVVVLPLAITGNVKHTELWDEHRKKYNRNKSGDSNIPRGYRMFWAGEKFILEADTTVTGTSTQATRVDVSMNGYTTRLSSLNTERTAWTGELWDKSFTGLSKGEIIFNFTVIYNNGVTKTDAVPVTIDGQTGEIVGVHRVK